MSNEGKTPACCNTATEPAKATCPARNERIYSPAINVFRTGDAVYVEAELPGVDAANLSIDLEHETMVVSGTTEPSPHDPTKLRHTEWIPGRYQRTFKLGPQIDREAISAEMKNGLLKLKLPLKPTVQPRKIQVDVADG